MSKNDYIVAIISTMVRVGIEDNDNFVDYVTNHLMKMSDLELQYELENLETYEIGLKDVVALFL